MPFCTNCGGQVNDGVAFCTNCGNVVSGASAQQQQQQQQQAYTQQQQHQAYTQQQTYTQPQPQAFYQEFMPGFGIGKRVIFTETSLVHGNEEFPYAQLSRIGLSSPPAPLTNGIAEAFVNGRQLTLAFTAKDNERFATAMAYANGLIDLAHGHTINYKYILLTHTGTKLEVYDDYFLLQNIPTEASGIIGAASNNASNIGGGLGKGLGKLIGGIGSVGAAIKGGVTEKIIMFEDLSAFQLYADSLAVNEYSIPISPDNMELARQIVTFVENAINSAKVEEQTQPEEDRIWEPIKGSAKTFTLLDSVLELPENMDVFNSYRLRFRDMASKHADEAEKEYNKKVRDLVTYMEFFPKIYGYHLAALAQKAVDILIAEDVWTVTFDSFLEQHTNNFHLIFDELSVTAENIALTAEANAKNVASITSFVPNLVGGGFGVKGALKGIAGATAFNLVRDGLEESAMRNAMNIKPAQQQELFQRINQKIVFHNLFLDYWRVFLTLVLTLNQSGHEVWYPSDELYQQSGNVFKNLSNPNFPKDKTLEVVLQILKIMPYNADYIKFIISRFGETEEVTAIKEYFGFIDFNDPRLC